ncbi:alanine racemase [Noviherbaspirillum sp.]|uniref:alanine racemase n=1 Tax=Noviherbaspirillum sp. TaxID=1926288 RepID=UPI002D27E8E3|nr:alanine racemase [Noviherbaspirillum sp.]HZW22152.1 alanine racemase [Noviherbaspirillum sp.]
MPAGRRTFLAALGAGAGAALLAFRPSDAGARHSAYFEGMSRALAAAGIATPTMVIDRERMLANTQRVLAHIGDRMRLRLVAKSLPSLPLLDQLMQGAATHRLMVFSLPALQRLTAERPGTELLLGKPLPVAAAARFYDSAANKGFRPERQLQWLVDTPQRLAQYRSLAQGRGLQMRLNIEIDVGLHRGGVESVRDLQEMIGIIVSEPRLELAGLMGYDAHVAKLPDIPGLRERALAESKRRYAECASLGRKAMPHGAPACFNTGGSLTYRLHDGSGDANELALGSALLKPSDFDVPLLHDLSPAAFIAAPVLKAGREFVLPYGVETIGAIASAWDVNQRQAYFIYGGNWLADPVSPAGLAETGLYGTSSNQQLLVGSGVQGLRPDDFVFLRPRQSEAVLQQFGDIAVFADGRISDWWPALPAGT